MQIWVISNQTSLVFSETQKDKHEPWMDEFYMFLKMTKQKYFQWLVDQETFSADIKKQRINNRSTSQYYHQSTSFTSMDTTKLMNNAAAEGSSRKEEMNTESAEMRMEVQEL